MAQMLTRKWRIPWLLLAVVGMFILYLLTALDLMSVEAGGMKRTRILHIIPSPSSCSCRGKKYDVIDGVEGEKRDDATRRRAEEYAKQQLRDSNSLGGVVISPPNSPLQYPSHGLTVEPLKSILLPGHTRKLKLRVSLYTIKDRDIHRTDIHKLTPKCKTGQVFLRAFHGVMAVQTVPEGQAVTGQNQSALEISATSLAALNEMLAQVTYSSAVYLLKMQDLVHFIFEDHEVMFPITIKKPSIPVLYDPGTDINSLVTIVTKTFLRYKELTVLIKSIRAKYPNIRVLIADDSFKTEKVEGHNVHQYIMPPAQGWFAGWNLVVSQVTSKYFLWVDDDFLFLNQTSIEKFVEVMEAVPNLDVLGGSVMGNQFYFTLEHEVGAEGEGGCLSRRQHQHHAPLAGFKDCVLVDGVVNYFLARTNAVRRVGFDPMLKHTDPSEFFMDGLGRLLVASCAGLVIGHQKSQSNHQYAKFRQDNDGASKLALRYFKNYLKCVAF